MKNLLIVFTLLCSVGLLGKSGEGPTAADSILISQHCDPEKNFTANRFTEIYNPSKSSVDLGGWKLVSIQNGEEEFTWDLSGFIAPGEALVMGFVDHTSELSPDFISASSNASWNGGDNDGAILKNASGSVQDYAVGLSFANRMMVRNDTVVMPSPVFIVEQWHTTGVENVKDATPGTHTCDLPLISAPTFEQLKPLNTSAIPVGTSYRVSATVKTKDSAGIDSVLFVYGDSPSTTMDTLLLFFELDTFYTDMQLNALDTISGYLIAYGANGQVSQSENIEVYGVCGDVAIPQVQAASDISSTSFKAHWATCAGAKAYRLDVWTEKGEEAQIYTSTNFVDGASPLPNNWSDNEKVYTLTAGFNGGKSLKLGTASEMGVLTSPSLSIDQEFKVIFYAKAYNAEEYSVSLVFANQSFALNSLTQDWNRYEVDFDAESEAHQLRFEAQRAYIDSVVIQTGGLEKEFVIQDEIVQNNYRMLSGLSNNTCYRYCLRTISPYDCESAESEIISLTTSDATPLYEQGNIARIMAYKGTIHIKLSQASQLEIYEITGRKVLQCITKDKCVMGLRSGIYLVRVNDTVTKVAVN